MANMKLTDNREISLEGKKIIFIGNSFIHHGFTVLRIPQTVLGQEERSGDRGYFYQLCKSNREHVDVTAWTFGGHTLTDLFDGCCHAGRGCDGEDHLSKLKDRFYDYVVISAGSRGKSDMEFLGNIQKIIDVFQSANPYVKFFYLCNVASYGISSCHQIQKNILNSLKLLGDMGVTVVDWGGFVMGLINGTVSVANATQPYNKNSFIICKSEIDGFHPNLLSGYITSLMLYCAMTEKSAVGQSYSFCNDPSVHVKFDFELYRRKHYSYNGSVTNFHKIFSSPTDMRGIQSRIDDFLKEKSYEYYQF